MANLLVFIHAKLHARQTACCADGFNRCTRNRLAFPDPGRKENTSAPISLAPAYHFKPPQLVFHAPVIPAPSTQPELDAAGQPIIPRKKVEEWLA
jgi:hypothetical protein